MDHQHLELQKAVYLQPQTNLLQQEGDTFPIDLYAASLHDKGLKVFNFEHIAAYLFYYSTWTLLSVI